VTHTFITEMKKLKSNLLGYCAFPCVLLLTANGQTQTAEEVFEAYFKNWYQVEVIVFERIESGSSDPESWPKNLSLAYPPNPAVLISQAESETQEETRKQQHLTSAPATAGDSKENRQLLEQLKQGNPKDPFYQKLIDSIEKSELERLTPREKPLVFLDNSTRGLNNEARLLGRDRETRILFHQAWRQPFTDQSMAKSLVVVGGDNFDGNFELEGTITLFVSRYLHIHTNLWLTAFEANFGQEREHWPALPDIPKPREVRDEKIDAALENNETEQWSIELEDSNSLDFDDVNTADLLGDYTSLAQKPYIVKHIITMEQKRRMRSGELHYLDHPKLGLLIRIDKYEPQLGTQDKTPGF